KQLLYHYFARLTDELQKAITNHNATPATRDELVDLASRLEKNILKKKTAKKPAEKKPALKASSAKGKDKSKDYTADGPSEKPKRDGYVKEDMDFISAKALARMLKRDKKQLVRYVGWIRVERTADGPLKVHVTEAAIDPRIPDALHAYRDLFDNEAANRKEPPYGPLYLLSARKQEVLREYLKKELAAGRIEHSISPAGAPLLFVLKADGDLRLCVDYRALNNVTIKDRCPLPLIEETLDQLVGAKYFTSLDLKDAYYRIWIREGDEWKTAFRYAKKTAAMTDLLKGNQDFNWTEAAHESFKKVKKHFEESPLLRHFDPTKRIKLETDSSDFGVSGILSQLFKDGKWHPVAFTSRKMQDRERN
ncbi:RNA-directed DNA polymerase (Reverse transcriptase), partial [Teratosphaeria destructans]